MQRFNPSTAGPSTFRAALTAATSGDTGSVVERAAHLRTLDKQLRQSLPEPLASHVRLGNVRDGRLVFLVDSPVWKAKLRLYADVIRDAASAAGISASAMTVKVATMLPVPPDAASPSPLTQAARDALRAAAATVEDPELKSQLLTMASVA
ncbi:DUF721 domain-containing protein [Chiayiivirga flava]|uniref:DUF721 domain-containing protein n=1 Tax=Chiayiivirga flava TaxID=659595 RepID=A0A7W8FZT3_9GAMM|nr:DUF721 domain-containing protein [Chiayiivirga flava]MBB5208792.1 hypothetical protein [Chiayiivirga flava]